MILVLLAVGLFLAFSNGANDNFKGAATLLGSHTTSYKPALIWVTLTTFLGSCAALFLAQKLIGNFSGRGLVPDIVAQMPSFSISVGLAAASTVLLATRLGFPISTTHALTGALVGAGFFASKGAVNLSLLFNSFFLPLLLSPLLAIIASMVIYRGFSFLRRRFDVRRESCLCLGNEVVSMSSAGFASGSSTTARIQIEGWPHLSIGTELTCEERYVGRIWGVSAKAALDAAHFLSAGAVSFARGLNDTPKIAALILIGGAVPSVTAIGTVALAMAFGGLLMARRIAETMSYKITEMNDGQGFSANFVTSSVVIGASLLGLPVSTTHVSCGSLFGIGSVTGQAHWKEIIKIVMAWVVTLPAAAFLAGLSYILLKGVL